MAINKYFRDPTVYTQTEKNIVIDAVAELIQISGVDFEYIPRTISGNLDAVFGEDVLSSFNTKYTIEMFINSIFEFDGQGDTIGDFYSIKDELSLTVSSSRFKEVTNMNVPLEGDLIYFYEKNSLFEIKYVEFEKNFYSYETTPKFNLRCTLFEYSHETLNTGISQVDKIDSTNTNVEGDTEEIDEFDNEAINDLLLSTFDYTPEDPNISNTESDDTGYDPNNPFGY